MHLPKIKNEDIRLLARKLEIYVEEENPEQYGNEMIINDVLYFLGISIDEERFQFGRGYDKFKKHIEIALESGK